jgi:hypothetical protein
MAKNESAKTKKTLNVQVRKETGIVRQHFLPSYFPDFFCFPMASKFNPCHPRFIRSSRDI